MSQYVCGVDIGGTNIKIGLFTHPEFNLVDKIEVKTPENDQENSIFKTVNSTLELLFKKQNISWNQVHGIGFAVPCPVTKGFISKCPNLSWEDLDMDKKLEVFIPSHVRVAVANDANAAALGEHGGIRQYDSSCVVTLGTGVGGGLIVEGSILEGASGLGGEIGHMHVFDDATETCGCGSKGCLEQICGTKGILNEASRLAQLEPTSIDLKHLTVKAVFDAAKQGDQVGFKVVDRVAKYLAKAMSIVSVITDPDVFIIGGGVSNAGEFFIHLIEKHFKTYARFTSGSKPFFLAQKGNDAGFIGAALLVKD